MLLREKTETLSEFLTNLWRFTEMGKLRFSRHSELKYIMKNLWEKGRSYFFKLRRDELKKEEEEAIKISEKRFLKTALSSFPAYGIRFITDDLYYYYYEPGVRKLGLEDLILHTLLIDRGSQTYTTYALLLLFKKLKDINFRVLREKAQRYDLVQNLENILRYINSNGEVRVWPLPKWDELREQANVYGIRIDRSK